MLLIRYLPAAFALLACVLLACVAEWWTGAPLLPPTD